MSTPKITRTEVLPGLIRVAVDGVILTRSMIESLGKLQVVNPDPDFAQLARHIGLLNGGYVLSLHQGSLRRLIHVEEAEDGRRLVTPVLTNLPYVWLVPDFPEA